MIFSAIPGDSSTSALLKYTRKLFSPTFLRNPFSDDAIFTTSSHITGSSVFFRRNSATSSGRCAISQIFFPMQSSPVTPTTISANSGITGSCTAGTFKGNLLAPSASTRRRSQKPDNLFRVSGSGPEIFGCPALCFAAITYPYCSISLQSSSVSSASAKGRSSSHAMWVVVVTITRFPCLENFSTR